MNHIEDFCALWSHYYARFAHFMTKDEKCDELRVKKRMTLYFLNAMMLYFTVLPLFNPYVSISKALFYDILCLSHYFVLKSKNYRFIVAYFLFFALFSIFICARNVQDSLRVVGIILIHHNKVLFLPGNKKLKFAIMIVSIIMVKNVQKQLIEALESGTQMSQIADAIKNLLYSWPLFYLINQFCAWNLEKEYCDAVKEAKESQGLLAKTNQELYEINYKLISTLSLLEQKNEELNYALQSRELFIASVSHEFRNPLNSMLGNIELLSLDVKDTKFLKMLDTCKICGEVLLGLINNILDVAKINAERLELNYVPTNFCKVIEKVWTVSTIKMRQKGLRGYLYISRQFPKYIDIDSHRLNQILLNLIGNATKFTKNGVIKVIISWHKDGNTENLQNPSKYYNKMVREKLNRTNSCDPVNDKENRRTLKHYACSTESINLSKNESKSEFAFLESNIRILDRNLPIKTLSSLNSMDYVSLNENETKIQERMLNGHINTTYKEKGILKIEIIDSGCGISNSALQRLFQPFSQADSSITRRFGGTGLGLYITKQLVQKMGGQIEVYSHENAGSDFCLLIPTQTATYEEVKEKVAEEADNNISEINSLEGFRALVVDDDPMNQMVMLNYLKRLNIKAEIANNGLEAVQKFEAQGLNYYSFITMDIQMPIMDGLTACKAIRKIETQKKADNSIPIIAVTGNCSDVEKNLCLDPEGEIKASYFFRKPFIFEECKSCVANILAKNKAYKVKQQSKKLKVLIVDDDPFNISIMQEYLQKHFFQCETARDGKEAVGMTKHKEYDVIIMDCEMPEMDGYTAARIIKGKYPNTLIIGVTGNLREECLQKAKASGMNDLKTKPVNFKKLVDILLNIETR